VAGAPETERILAPERESFATSAMPDTRRMRRPLENEFA